MAAIARRAGRRRALALAFALVAHAVIFTGLILGRSPDPQYADLPAFEVQLLRPPPPREPPKTEVRPPPLKLHAASRPPPPGVAPLPAPAPDASEALAGAAFAEGRRPSAMPQGRRGCLEGAKTEKERELCDRFFARQKAAVPLRTPGDDDKYGGFAMATRRKEAIRTYKDSRTPDTFPGLRCSFGRTCDPATGPLNPGGTQPR